VAKRVDASAVAHDGLGDLVLDGRHRAAAVGARVELRDLRVGDAARAEVGDDAGTCAVEQALLRDGYVVVILNRGVADVELDQIEEREVGRRRGLDCAQGKTEEQRQAARLEGDANHDVMLIPARDAHPSRREPNGRRLPERPAEPTGLA